MKKIVQNRIYLPEEDLIGALKGLIYIQYTYDIKTQDFADGNIFGNYRRQMTAIECTEMMIIAFYTDLTMQAVEWFNIAIEKIEKGDETISLSKFLSKAAATAYDVRF